ncbi:MAG: phospholipase D-like domain-containing protein [Isosphaeraceae bacterium]|nr:phospholipase D-like domain-containing protein [Isosphaeraceae bacterium]
MNPDEIRELLMQTLADRRLSRNERQALAELFQDLGEGEERLNLCRQSFALAREQLADPAGHELLGWLEEIVRAALYQPQRPRRAEVVEAHFSPGDDCPRRIAQLFERARGTADVCVFTITDNRVSDAILEAHRRGIAVRIITDNEKADDEGSDIPRLKGAGIPVRIDRSEYHMHHKFAIFDESPLLTGSFNWTRGAAEYNEENFVITSDQRLIRLFAQRFERLWDKLA